MKHVLFFLNLSLTLLFVLSGCLSVPSEREQEQHITTVTVTKKPVISRGQGVATRKVPWTKEVPIEKVNPETGLKEWTTITLKGENTVLYSYTWYRVDGVEVTSSHYPDAWYHRFLKDADAWYHRFLKDAPETP